MAKQASEKTAYWAVVPAAGIGQRMQQSTPKQYLSLNGKTVLENTLAVLLENQTIEKVVVSLSAQDDRWASLKLPEQKLISTTGGDNRQQSVLNGLNALSELAKEHDWVLVHDAARPCLSAVLLDKIIQQLSDDPVGGIVALPSKDTVKQASQSVVKTTLDRQQIWLAQTPQMFRYGLLKQALQQAIEKNANITDEASAMEFVGHLVQLVEGEIRNLKLTVPEDLKIAEFWLNQS